MLSTQDILEFTVAFNKYNQGRLEPIAIDNVSTYQILQQLEAGFHALGGISEELVRDIDRLTRPMGPTKETEWLSNYDIINAMAKYEREYPDFQFFGAVPLDCEDYEFCPLKNLDFNKAHKIGVVYNLDKYGQRGSHWVALYMDVDKCEVYFSDSVGKPPKPNIENLINRFRQHCNGNITYKYNTSRYQKDDTECGVYSINFIVRLLKGDKYEDIVQSAPTFEQINSCRNTYFANQPSRFQTNYKCE